MSKEVAPPPKTFCNIFTQVKYTVVNFASMLPVYTYTYLSVLVDLS